MHIFSWAEIDGLIDLLAESLRERPFDSVVGISRSGLIPAVMLSHRLGVRDFAILDIPRTATEGANAPKRPPEMRGVLNEGLLDGRRLLVVDDIVGSGETMAMARRWLTPRARAMTCVALVVNQDNLGTRDLAALAEHVAASVHGWVAFPWEHHPQEEDACAKP
ncbi:phosphoribosyltransferase [Azospirillum sp. B506]|uniref:phosphoribosyltransferase n=1 Tax=Azospirillum sp. B506 TaxID=137721 RepID=UPI00034B1B9D|nr:phosphoribosyltransferase family protein [Azospirillum sp. B506]